MNRWELELNQVEDALVHTWKLEFNYNGSEILNWNFQMTVGAGNSQQIKSEIHIFLRKKQLHIMIFVEDGNGDTDIHDSLAYYEYDKTAKVYLWLNLNQNCERVNV